MHNYIYLDLKWSILKTLSIYAPEDKKKEMDIHVSGLRYK